MSVYDAIDIFCSREKFQFSKTRLIAKSKKTLKFVILLCKSDFRKKNFHQNIFIFKKVRTQETHQHKCCFFMFVYLFHPLIFTIVNIKTRLVVTRMLYTAWTRALSLKLLLNLPHQFLNIINWKFNFFFFFFFCLWRPILFITHFHAWQW